MSDPLVEVSSHGQTMSRCAQSKRDTVYESFEEIGHDHQLAALQPSKQTKHNPPMHKIAVQGKCVPGEWLFLKIDSTMPIRCLVNRAIAGSGAQSGSLGATQREKRPRKGRASPCNIDWGPENGAYLDPVSSTLSNDSDRI